MDQPQTKFIQPNREKFSSDKLIAVRELIFGNRAFTFQALLKEVPSVEELSHLCEHLKITPPKNLLFDLDGTLVPPYRHPDDRVREYLESHKEGGGNVIIFTNSPPSERLGVLMGWGFPVPQTTSGKPSLSAFSQICREHYLNPIQTAMIGNYAVTDAPRMPKGKPPLFPLNLLVKSIPPEKDGLTLTQYARARFFHLLNLAAAEVVKMKNPGIMRVIP